MSEQKGSGAAITVGALIAAPFAIVPAAFLLLGGGDSTPASGTCATSSSLTLADGAALPTIDGYSDHQIETAATIMQVAADKALPAQAQLIALMVAMQESTLGVNTQPTGTGNDAGPFQQRTQDGWYGTLEQVQDVAYAAECFYLGHDITYAGPGSAGPPGYHLPGLLDVTGWESMEPGVAAQTVQGSAHPDAYAPHQSEAERIIALLTGTDFVPGAGGCSIAGAATGDIAKAIEAGRTLIGTPYEFGGGGADGIGATGIDCSGFTQFMFAAIGITLPRTSQAQFDYLAANEVSPDAIAPGDLIFYAKGRTGTVGSANAISHVAMFTGDGMMIESTRYNGGTTPGVQEVTAQITDGHGYVGIRRVPGASE